MPIELALAFAAFAAALGFALTGAASFARARRARRVASVLERALGKEAAASPRKPGATPRRLIDVITRTAAGGESGAKWLDTRLGKMIVADEDRRLIERCGYHDAGARVRFLVARLTGALVLPSIAIAFTHAHGARLSFLVSGALVAGFMAPKWFVRRKAAARQRAVANELPMFVDLLRILQGVGLSLDQSLSIVVSDFAAVLPVLAQEVAIAQAQYATGRTREQAMKRLTTSYESDELSALLRLMTQIEQHGGAVQEPLRQFGDRLREARRTGLRERIGKLTVKMTGVMVLTLLPALLVMTAGPGFLAVFHSLAGLHK
ncbi:type II secretion system protein [Caballeronia peredens]|nr:type II secretion system protein [Caballeronia peredens]